MATFLRLLALCLMFSLAFPVAADDKIGKNDLDAQKELLQLKIDSNRELVQKDIESLKTRIDALDKRIDDQSSRIGDIGQSVDRFAVILGVGGLLVTVLLALGGLVGYFSVAKKAAEEAQSASQKWFDDNQQKLVARIGELEKAAEHAHQKIDNSVNYVEQHSNAAIEQIQMSLNAPNEQAQPINDIARKTLQQAATQLKEKPEASYSFEDWNTRAFDAYNSEQYEDAVLYWKHASSILNAGAVKTAQALFNRAVILTNKLKRHDEACTVYEELITIYSSDNTPAIRERVAKAMLNMGVALGKMEKPDESIATFEKLIATYSSDNTPAIRELVAKAMFNMGVTLGERQDEEIATYEKLIATYSSDDTPAISKLVADAFNGKGFAHLIEAKKAWNDKDQALALLRDAQTNLLTSLDLRANCGMTRGNLAYVQWLLGDRQEAEESFRTALVSAQNGGEALYHGTLKDIAMHTIHEDDAFRDMVERLWAEYQTVKSS